MARKIIILVGLFSMNCLAMFEYHYERSYHDFDHESHDYNRSYEHACDNYLDKSNVMASECREFFEKLDNAITSLENSQTESSDTLANDNVIKGTLLGLYSVDDRNHNYRVYFGAPNYTLYIKNGQCFEQSPTWHKVNCKSIINFLSNDQIGKVLGMHGDWLKRTHIY